ncbi:hypothetical protein AC249_AIPGENE10390 [Exaiptasia diaphana]|nr:hypothetical protein AC249_AIPGENE10390 [Exaiptasia diaphana]
MYTAIKNVIGETMVTFSTKFRSLDSPYLEIETKRTKWCQCLPQQIILQYKSIVIAFQPPKPMATFGRAIAVRPLTIAILSDNLF